MNKIFRFFLRDKNFFIRYAQGKQSDFYSAFTAIPGILSRELLFWSDAARGVNPHLRSTCGQGGESRFSPLTNPHRVGLHAVCKLIYHKLKSRELLQKYQIASNTDVIVIQKADEGASQITDNEIKVGATQGSFWASIVGWNMRLLFT